MAKYRNTRTGLVIDVPEQPVTRTRRRGRDKQWAQKLNGMSKSKRWDRVHDSTPAGMPKVRPKKRKKGKGDPEPAAPRYPEGVPDDKWTVPQLDAWAEDNSVDLSKAANKGEKLALIGDALHTADSGGQE